MTKEERYLKVGGFLISIIKYMLDPEHAPRPCRPQEVSWEEVYHLSDIHQFLAIVYDFIAEGEDKPTEELLKKWKRASEIAVYADISQHYAIEEIKEKCAEQKLKILPIKGLYMKALYPQSHYRQMGDLDIVYEKARYDELEKIMQALDYHLLNGHEEYYHQEFLRPPVMHVETHWAMMPEITPYYEFFAQPFARALDTEDEYVKRLSKEDEFIFMIAHGYKHYCSQGCGIRTVVDYLLYEKRYGEELDREEISARFDEADAIAVQHGEEREHGLKYFENLLKTLCVQWFEGDAPEIDEIGLYFISSGAFGSMEHRWDKNLDEQGGKFKYLLYRAFPPYKIMKERHKVLKKCPVLLPFFWIKRLFRGLFVKRKEMAQEVKYVKNQKTEK